MNQVTTKMLHFLHLSYFHCFFADCISDKTVESIKEDLESVLEEVVEITADKSLHLLLDLHYQLSRILKNYVWTCKRKNLPAVNVYALFFFYIIICFCIFRTYEKN